ncbi:MAG: 4Fe-4S binding protein [Clostridium sp.]|nr:4Fe-4S binding protein [Clostridium sp.]
MFYPILIHSKKFYATNACISCGKCENVCPLGNIQLENGKPNWGSNCTHCSPKEAIEYGRQGNVYLSKINIPCKFI